MSSSTAPKRKAQSISDEEDSEEPSPMDKLYPVSMRGNRYTFRGGHAVIQEPMQCMECRGYYALAMLPARMRATFAFYFVPRSSYANKEYQAAGAARYEALASLRDHDAEEPARGAAPDASSRRDAQGNWPGRERRRPQRRP